MDDPIPGAPSVLVVDDSDVVRLLVAKMLEAVGYPVHTAVDGVEALKTLARIPIDVVVTDLLMPRLDGRKLAVEITARWPAVRMIFMTGHPDEKLTVNLPGPLVMKPFGIDQLAELLRQYTETMNNGTA
jgi:two-component system, cell cycle sensor histidine kinase and response regulator CckA